MNGRNIWFKFGDDYRLFTDVTDEQLKNINDLMEINGDKSLIEQVDSPTVEWLAKEMTKAAKAVRDATAYMNMIEKYWMGFLP